jgi:hypothetical protein
VLVTGYGRERLPKGALQEVLCVRKPVNCHQMIVVNSALSSTSQRPNSTTKENPATSSVGAALRVAVPVSSDCARTRLGGRW